MVVREQQQPQTVIWIVLNPGTLKILSGSIQKDDDPESTPMLNEQTVLVSNAVTGTRWMQLQSNQAKQQDDASGWLPTPMAFLQRAVCEREVDAGRPWCLKVVDGA